MLKVFQISSRASKQASETYALDTLKAYDVVLVELHHIPGRHEEDPSIPEWAEVLIYIPAKREHKAPRIVTELGKGIEVVLHTSNGWVLKYRSHQTTGDMATVLAVLKRVFKQEIELEAMELD